MTALDEWVQDTLWPRAAFVPCDMSQPCENCDHPMRGHFRQAAEGFATACSECSCQDWCCRHGGHRTAVGS